VTLLDVVVRRVDGHYDSALHCEKKMSHRRRGTHNYNAFLPHTAMSITGNARFDWLLQGVSERRFYTWASGATDAEFVSLGLRLGDMVAEGLVESIIMAMETFTGPDGLMAFVRCGAPYFSFSSCTFSDVGFSTLCRWMRNTAPVGVLCLYSCDIPYESDAGVGNISRLADAISTGLFKEVRFKAKMPWYSDATTCLMLAVGRSRNVISFTLDVDVSDVWGGVDYLQQLHTWGHALHWNTTMQEIICYGIRDIQSFKYVQQTACGNRDVAQIIDAQTPPLGDGYGTDSGDWEALPNELVCAVAERVWPPTAALEMAYVCQRFRDCVLSDYVVRLRHGADADGRWGYGDWRLFYRDVWLEIEQQREALRWGSSAQSTDASQTPLIHE
jgi:hypothetical protein